MGDQGPFFHPCNIHVSKCRRQDSNVAMLTKNEPNCATCVTSLFKNKVNGLLEGSSWKI